MGVVSDSSVLIHLARAGCFYLLKYLYEEVMIPTGVYFEVVERGWGFPGSPETKEAVRDGWLKMRRVSDRDKVANLMQRYGVSLGNAETVQLALECEAELALADEAEVREALEEYGLRVRGCIGILIEAVRKKVISAEEAKKAMAKLVETGYRVSDDVFNEAYRLLGEEI
jgi:hypothetical protein